MDGRPLTDLLGGGPVQRTASELVTDGAEATDEPFTEEERQQIMKRLQDLGYV